MRKFDEREPSGLLPGRNPFDGRHDVQKVAVTFPIDMHEWIRVRAARNKTYFGEMVRRCIQFTIDCEAEREKE